MSAAVSVFLNVKQLAAASAASVVVAGGIVAFPTTSMAAPAATYSVTATIPVGLLPGSIALDASLHRAYVTSYHDGTVSVVDTAENRLLTSLAVATHTGGIAVDTVAPRLVKAMAGARAGASERPAITSPIFGSKHVVFVGTNIDHTIVMLDASTYAVEGTIELGENIPEGLAVDPTSDFLYVAGAKGDSATQGELSIIDESTATVKNTLVTSNILAGAAVDSGNHEAFFTGCCYGQIGVLTGPTSSVLRSVSVPGSGGAAVDPSTHRVFVTNGNSSGGSVAVLDESTDAIVDVIAVGKEPTGIAFDAGDNLVYVANSADNTVSVIDATTDAVVATVPVGRVPGPIAVDTTTHTAYVVNGADNTVSAIARTVTGPVSRLAGADRLGTAIAVSQKEFAAGAASAVVLARGDDYPDALVGAPLAVARNAPLLLTVGGALSAATLAEIQRVLPAGNTVYILGGTSAVPASVESQVTGAGYQVTRYAGASRFATAVKVADALGDPGTVLLATGLNFPDALSAGVAAAKAGGVVLLTQGSTLPSETSDYLAAHPGTVYAVGGPAAAAAPSATPIVGADRYQTAIDVAQRFFSAPSVVGIATGLSFPDALAGGALLGRDGGPLVLVARSSVPSAVRDYLAGIKSSVTTCYVFGGTATLDATVESAIDGALS